MKYTNNKNNISEILKVYIINSITKSYILNIKIRPLMTEYALTIKVEKDTMGKKKTCQRIVLNFIYIVLWDVPNKISKFENRFPGLF
jgi:hypothetical protein